MKSVLISIRPKWCELIASGKKTVEIRKTSPKLQTPFRCYIYCTQGSGNLYDTLMSADRCHVLNGKVIGEFVCDRIEMVNAQCSDTGIDIFYHDCKKYGCLSQIEVEKYFGVYDEERTKDLRAMKGNGYAWHISDLKIYDTPKKLGEFYVKCGDRKIKCDDCKYKKQDSWFDPPYCEVDGYISLARPFQSWGYVDEL